MGAPCALLRSAHSVLNSASLPLPQHSLIGIAAQPSFSLCLVGFSQIPVVNQLTSVSMAIRQYSGYRIIDIDVLLDGLRAGTANHKATEQEP